MPNLLFARLLLVYLVSSQSIAPASVDYSGYVGKFATWGIDTNFNGYDDTIVRIFNITATVPVVDSPDDLICDISEGWGTSTFEISGSALEWNGYDLVSAGGIITEGRPLGCAGISRTTVVSEYSVGENSYDIFYDEDTLLLMAIFINETIEYVYIQDTDVFLTTSMFTSYMIIFSIILIAVIVTYVIGIVFSDKKKKSVMARFDREFWND